MPTCPNNNPKPCPRPRPLQPLDHHRSIERHNRLLAEEFLYAQPFTSDAERSTALATWNVHYNYHRSHTACGNQPPASRTPARVMNVLTSNT